MEEPVVVVTRPGRSEAPPDPVDAPYALVEAALRGLGLDAGRAGSAAWNPLGDLIAPGDRVLVHAGEAADRALLRPILDYALRAAGPRGRVTLAGAPAVADRDDVHPSGVRALLDGYEARRQPIDVVDLRHFRVVPRLVLDGVRRFGRAVELGLLVRERLPGDPLGYDVVDVSERSYFEDVAERAPRLRGDRARPLSPRTHHGRGRHEYSIPRTLLDADVILDLARLKTHAQSGVGLALDAAIAISNEPAWLPRYTAGAAHEGGDEFPFAPPWSTRLEHRLRRWPLLLDHAFVAHAARPEARPHGFILDGGWEGNDTLWRTTLDLNLVRLYADRNGRLADRPQRRYLAFVDGLGGQAAAATAGVGRILVAGRDPALVDVAAARAMGYDERRLPAIARALAAGGRPLLPSSDAGALRIVHDGPPPQVTFTPPRSWPSLAR